MLLFKFYWKPYVIKLSNVWLISALDTWIHILNVLEAIRNAKKLFLIETKVDGVLISDSSAVISSIMKEAVLKFILHDRLFSSRVMCVNKGFSWLDLVTKIKKKKNYFSFAYALKLQNEIYEIICNNLNKRQKFHKLISHLLV